MNIMANPKNIAKAEDINYGTVFEMCGEFYIKINCRLCDCNTDNMDITITHLGSGIVKKILKDEYVHVVSGYFVEDYTI